MSDRPTVIPVELSNLVNSVRSINESLRKEDASNPYTIDQQIPNSLIQEKLKICNTIREEANKLKGEYHQDQLALEEISGLLRGVTSYHNFYQQALKRRNTVVAPHAPPLPPVKDPSFFGSAQEQQGDVHKVDETETSTDKGSVSIKPQVKVQLEEDTEIVKVQVETEEDIVKAEEDEEIEATSIVDEQEDINKIVFEEEPPKVTIDTDTDEAKAKAANAIQKFKEENMSSVRTVSKQGTDKTIKLMQNLEFDMQKIKLLDIDMASDPNFQKTYFQANNTGMLTTPRVTKTIHPFSGFYSEISAYNQFELFGVNRALSSESDFVRQEYLKYNSIHEHVRFTSFKANPTFEEWTKSLLLVDLNSLFFGVYDANYPGQNLYEATCQRCGSDINIKVANDDLACHINKGFDQNYINELMTIKEKKKLSNQFTDKWQKTIFRHKFSLTGIIAEFEIPTLATYLETIEALSTLISSNRIYNIDISDIDNPDSNYYNLLRILLYVKKLGLPVPGDKNSDGVVPVKYISTKDRIETIGVLMQLNRNDFGEMFSIKEVKEMASLKGIDYYIKDVQCENPQCKAILYPLYINPKEIFFSKLGEETSRMNLMARRKA